MAAAYSSRFPLGKSVSPEIKIVLFFWLQCQASYVLTGGSAKGLGLGNSYISEAFLDAANTFTLGAYNLLDATVFYNRPKYSVRVKANNMLDKKYWVSDGYYARPQKPFNFMASVAYKF